ncbi:MAG: insulinase family protein [Actinobacteria bacterium]|nr:insulinase family protein [Actinomycetota bacterium]
MLERPEVSPPEPWLFPAAQASELANGLGVVSYDIPGQYVISVRLAVPMPLDREPRDREGIATIMARTLDEGTARHTAEEFAELLERKGIALGAGASDSGLIVDLDVPKRHLTEALDLLSQAVREPAFPENEVSRHIKTRLAEIDQERAVPGQRAALEFITTYFDGRERASRPTAGTKETVSAITPQDLVAFHAANVVPSGATVVVAGDLGDLDIVSQVEHALGSWSGAAADLVEPRAAARSVDAARIVFVDRPGSVQTEFYLGCPGPDRRVEGGWAAYQVLGFVIGGSPNARVDAVLREDKGFTYGIRSGFRPRRREGMFLTSGSVRADSTVEALGLLLDILDKAREGFTTEETQAGVDFIGKTAPGRYATADTVAEEAAGLSLEGLTTEFTTANLLALADVDAAALTAALDRYVNGEWTVIVVGDASLYAEGVRGLGRGEVTILPA